MPRKTLWKHPPGGLDRLHLGPEFKVMTEAPTDEHPWGFPVFKHTDPVSLINAFDRHPLYTHQYGERIRNKQHLHWTVCHFFADDYRFEPVWTNPWRGLKVVQQFGWVLGPDFSCYTDWPFPANLWNVYRNRWLCAFWQQFGVPVIPTLTWSDYNSFEFVFSGYAKRGTYAIAGPPRGRVPTLYLMGITALMQRLEPRALVVYGRYPEEVQHAVESMADSSQNPAPMVRRLARPTVDEKSASR